MTVEILIGDCLEKLRALPAESVHCAVTSPPYYGLRDYGVEGAIGLEATPDEHIDKLVEVFREVRRVLRKDGTLWLNYGDSYTSGGRVGHGTRQGYKQQTNRGMNGTNDPARPAQPVDLKPKDLLMMPARVALAFQADGWWLRSEIIWAKSNPMPESCTDRPTSAHEKVYLLTKSARYFYDAEAVREASNPAQTEHNNRYAKPYDNEARIAGGQPGNVNNVGIHSRPGPGGRNLRNVWTIATAPFPEAHFATFPPALVEPCIKAGTSEKGACPGCGAPWVREMGERYQTEGRGSGNGFARPERISLGGPGDETPWVPKARNTIGWSTSCACDAGSVPATCLDPFGGAGTVGLVADRLGRDAILIELNPDYAAMARRRIDQDAATRGKGPAPIMRGDDLPLFGR